MIGFELLVKGEKISAALKNGVVSIIVTKLSTDFGDSIDIDFTGLDTSNPEKSETIDWLKGQPEIGDEILIRVVEIEEVSQPIRVEAHSIESVNDQNLKAYYTMKKDLEEKGLI